MGLPPKPTSPFSRRGSNSRVSSPSPPPSAPNRSRSLDGLLEPTGSSVEESSPSPNVTRSCEELDKDLSEPSKCDKECENKLPKLVMPSYENVEQSNSDSEDKNSMYSGSSDLKRKLNFMDKCVNKVRSLIKK